MKFEFQSKKFQKKYVLDIEASRIRVYDSDKLIVNSNRDVELKTIIDLLRLYEATEDDRSLR
jgi:hypothetical protein